MCNLTELKSKIRCYEYTQNQLHLFGDSGVLVENVRVSEMDDEIILADITLYMGDKKEKYYNCEYHTSILS